MKFHVVIFHHFCNVNIWRGKITIYHLGLLGLISTIGNCTLETRLGTTEADDQEDNFSLLVDGYFVGTIFKGNFRVRKYLLAVFLKKSFLRKSG